MPGSEKVVPTAGEVPLAARATAADSQLLPQQQQQQQQHQQQQQQPRQPGKSKRRGCCCCLRNLCGGAGLVQRLRRAKASPALLPFFEPVMQSETGSVYCLPSASAAGEQPLPGAIRVPTLPPEQLSPEQPPLASFEFRPNVSLAPKPGEKPEASARVVVAGPAHADREAVMFFVVEPLAGGAKKGSHLY